jgi:hypothetical protein
MNTHQIDEALRIRCRGQFLGVYACDTLPRVLPTKRPLLLICNTDPLHKPGTHWVAISIENHNKGDFFDSFGRQPEIIFKRFMNKHCSSWSFNEKQLQSAASRFCGQYCVFYCLYRSINVTAKNVVKCFTNDTGLNDWMVHNFICKLLNN